MSKGRTPPERTAREGQKLGKVEVTNGFGHNSKQPFVEVNWPTDSGKIQLAPDEARLIARMIAECAEAAEQDAFLVAFMMDEVGLTFNEAAQIIPRYAAWRKEQAGKRRTPAA